MKISTLQKHLDIIEENYGDLNISIPYGQGHVEMDLVAYIPATYQGQLILAHSGNETGEYVYTYQCMADPLDMGNLQD
jgi:phosphatidylinositol kinase/protein kinase (PI-3  family)